MQHGSRVGARSSAAPSFQVGALLARTNVPPTQLRGVGLAERGQVPHLPGSRAVKSEDACCAAIPACPTMQVEEAEGASFWAERTRPCRRLAVSVGLDASDVGGQEVDAVAVQVAAGAVVVLGRARIRMPGEDLGVAERDAGVQGVGDRGVA